jgi:hypothetical protein
MTRVLEGQPAAETGLAHCHSPAPAAGYRQTAHILIALCLANENPAIEVHDGGAPGPPPRPPPGTAHWRHRTIDVTEPQVANNLLRRLFRRTGPDGAPVSDGRFCEAAFLLTRHARRALPAGLGPENIALPLGHLVESRQLALPAIATDVPLPGHHHQQAAGRGRHPC